VLFPSFPSCDYFIGECRLLLFGCLSFRAERKFWNCGFVSQEKRSKDIADGRMGQGKSIGFYLRAFFVFNVGSDSLSSMREIWGTLLVGAIGSYSRMGGVFLALLEITGNILPYLLEDGPPRKDSHGLHALDC
jgi:hypothetical protein